MARQKVQGVYRDLYGNIIAQGTITVSLTASSTLATIYAASAGGVPITGSYVTSDQNGLYSFWMDEASYAYTQLFRLTLTKTGVQTQVYDDVSLYKPFGMVMDVDYLANTIMKADTDYTPETLEVHEDRIVGRLLGGEIKDLTPAEALLLITGFTSLGGNPYQLKSMYVPSVEGGMYEAWKGGWEPFWFNQQWGGAGWFDNLIDGATGEAYTFQAATGYTDVNRYAGGAAFGYDNTYCYAAQGFKVSKSMTLSRVWLKMYKVGNPTANAQLSIYDDNAGDPNAAIADGAATAIAGTLITSSDSVAWYCFTFATPPALSANTKYHIVLSSSSNSTTNYFRCVGKATTVYPHTDVLRKGSNVPAWSAYSGMVVIGFLIEPVTNMLAAGGQFDGKLTFSEGTPLDQSEAMVQPLRNFFNYQEGTISIVGKSWTKDKTILDFTYGLDHDRIVLRCNVTTGYAQADLYEKDGTKHTVTSDVDISDATVRRLTIKYRAKNDGSDFLYLYINETSEGSPVTGASIQFDPLMKELGHAILGGGYAITPAWTKDEQFAALPSTNGWTYAGTTESTMAVVANNKLYLQIVGSTDYAWWHIHPTLANADGWQMLCKNRVPKSSDLTGIAETAVYITDNTNIVVINFHTYWVEISYDHGSTYAKHQIDMTKNEHIFSIEGKGADLRVYCDGRVIFDGTGLFTHADAGGASIFFGDGTGTAGQNAESIWDYIKYYETASLPPQFTSGILSEFAYFSGDQTGLLSALYNSGTLKSVKELCGVGRNYIEVEREEKIQKAITSAPTTASTSAVLLTDMELFAYGKIIKMEVCGTFLQTVGTITALPLYCDGIAIDDDTYGQYAHSQGSGEGNVLTNIGLVKTFFGLHKSEGKWYAGANTSTAATKTRKLIVEAK